MSAASLALLNVGFAEMVVLGVVALLVFGERLPEVMRNMGRTYGKLRRSLQEATRPVREELARVEREAHAAISTPVPPPPPDSYPSELPPLPPPMGGPSMPPAPPAKVSDEPPPV